jgi:hypothetical protein
MLNLEEYKLKVFVNRVLTRIVGPKRGKVARNWKELHTEELHNMCSLPNFIRVINSRRMRFAGHVARMREARNEYNILVGKIKWKGPLGRHKHRWKSNTEVDLRQIR